jgi:uncharacterized membrane protein
LINIKLPTTEAQHHEEPKKGSVKELLKNEVYRRNLLIAIVLWCSVLMGYYTIYFHIRYLEGDFFYNVLAFGVCELSAYGVGLYFTKKVGVKNSYTLSFIMTFVAGCLYGMFRDT